MANEQSGLRKLIALLAFGCAALDWPIPLLLVVGVALFIEKDAWLNRQVLQAGILYAIYKFAVLVVKDWIFGGLGGLFDLVKAGPARNAMYTVGNIFSTIFLIVFIALNVWAIVRLLMGKEASLPLISGLAKKASEDAA